MMQAYIAIPLNPDFMPVWKSIKRACSENDIKPVRADMLLQIDNVQQTIFQEIAKSHLVIVDFSIPNSSVIDEVQYAAKSNKPVIIITQSTENLPFDWKECRAIEYKLDDNGLDFLFEVLTESLHEIKERLATAGECEKQTERKTEECTRDKASSEHESIERIDVEQPKVDKKNEAEKPSMLVIIYCGLVFGFSSGYLGVIIGFIIKETFSRTEVLESKVAWWVGVVTWATITIIFILMAVVKGTKYSKEELKKYASCATDTCGWALYGLYGGVLAFFYSDNKMSWSVLLDIFRYSICGLWFGGLFFSVVIWMFIRELKCKDDRAEKVQKKLKYGGDEEKHSWLFSIVYGLFGGIALGLIPTALFVWLVCGVFKLPGAYGLFIVTEIIFIIASGYKCRKEYNECRLEGMALLFASILLGGVIGYGVFPFGLRTGLYGGTLIGGVSLMMCVSNTPKRYNLL